MLAIDDIASNPRFTYRGYRHHATETNRHGPHLTWSGCVRTMALGMTLTDLIKSFLPLLTMITASLKLTALPFVLAPKHIHEAAPQSAKATAPAEGPTKGSSAEPVDDPLLGKQRGSVADQIVSSWWGALWRLARRAFSLSSGILHNVASAIYRVAKADGDA